MFDILWSMKGVLEHLDWGEPSTIGFTENADLIEFLPEDGKVCVSCTYATAETVCELADLKDAWPVFWQTVLRELSGDHPRLATNSVLAELRL
ncbi:hypothetical protein ACIQPR_45880 [Streptomyces sp. NPDC091280]|uniref:hypothetical protein n=1 Tax=Streptomyces sp. NPDC091280 TaxID=3365984 RepID=UPI0038017D4E